MPSVGIFKIKKLAIRGNKFSLEGINTKSIRLFKIVCVSLV